MILASAAASLVSASAGGPGIARLPAQQLARRELSRSIYRPSLTQRVEHAVSGLFSRLFGHLNAAVPGGWWALVALAIAVVLATALVVHRAGPATSRRGSRGAVLAGAARSARDHRAEAERRAAAGDYAAAIIERVRAIAVGLEERGELPPGPGRTADELAAEAGRSRPALGAELIAGARLFDDVRYGGRPGAAAGYQRVSDLDDRLLAARPGGAPALELAGRRPGISGPVPAAGSRRDAAGRPPGPAR